VVSAADIGLVYLERKLAPLGSYTNPMSAAETTAFVHKQQQMWQPILDEIAKNQR